VGFLLRSVLAILGTAAAVCLAHRASTTSLLGFTAAIFAIHVLHTRSFERVLRRFLPILVFAAGMYGVSFFGERATAKLPLQVIFVFASVWLLGRLCSKTGRVPRSRILFRLFLFAHFVRHFAEVLGDETRQTVIARGLAAPSLFRPGGFSSLVHALNSILQRCLIRAERFYAAQSIKGLSV
jgi:hypothetical protein